MAGYRKCSFPEALQNWESGRRVYVRDKSLMFPQERDIAMLYRQSVSSVDDDGKEVSRVLTFQETIAWYCKQNSLPKNGVDFFSFAQVRTTLGDGYARDEIRRKS